MQPAPREARIGLPADIGDEAITAADLGADQVAVVAERLAQGWFSWGRARAA